jgi:NAD(P)-dependent dehydrogenase (short-subunit alcohol dehydrogenase family)
MNNSKLKALITGGTSGLGKSIAEGFADAGYEVIATGVGQIPKNKNNIEFCSLDVLDEASIKKKIEKIDYINVLINAAGTIARHKELKPRIFSQVVDVNLNGTMRVCSEARGLLSKSKGSIINIASMLSYFGGGVVPGYSASKGGIVQLTKSLSIAYSQDQIRVNAIAPGWISTPMTEELKLDAKRNENIINRTPMGRWGEPKELVGPALFLSSKAASFITGTVLNVDGGYACM